MGAKRENEPTIPRDQRWFHHPEMQARIAAAEADRREGRVFRTETVEEAQALLDSWKARRVEND